MNLFLKAFSEPTECTSDNFARKKNMESNKKNHFLIHSNIYMCYILMVYRITLRNLSMVSHRTKFSNVINYKKPLNTHFETKKEEKKKEKKRKIFFSYRLYKSLHDEDV